MDADFDEATKRVLTHEGGYGWNKKDKGGPTKFGITCYDYAEFLGKKMNSMEAWAPIVRAMPLSDAMSIYRRKYWSGMHCDVMAPGVDYAIYDYGINSGVGRPARVAQTLLKLPLTGRIDVATLAGLKTCNPDKFVDAICDERLQFMHNIRGGEDWAVFGGGWGTRVREVRTVGKAMVKAVIAAPIGPKAQADAAVNAARVAPQATPIAPEAMGKATHVDPQAGSGVKKATIITTAAQTPAHAATHSNVWLAASIIIGTVVIGGVIYYVIRHRQAKAQDTVVLPQHLVGVSLAA